MTSNLSLGSEKIEVSSAMRKCQSSESSESETAAAVTELPVCQYFARTGRCRYGVRCHFSHSSAVKGAGNLQDRKSAEAEGSDPQLNDTESDAVTVVSGKHTEQDNDERKLCRYYSTGKKCWRGERCKFIHAIVKAEVDSSQLRNKNDKTCPEKTQEAGSQKQNEAEELGNDVCCLKENESKKSAVNSGKQPRLCRYFKQGRCSKGEKCRFKHPVLDSLLKVDDENDWLKRTRTTPVSGVQPMKRKVMDKVKLENFSDEDQKLMRDREITQLKKRFPQFSELGDGQFKVTFAPTDPDWPYDVKEVQMGVTFPPDYPKKLFHIRLCQDPALPGVLHRYVDRIIREWVVDREKQLTASGEVETCFRPFLRWLDRNLEETFTEGLRRRKKELMAEAVGIQIVPMQQLRESLPDCTAHDPTLNGPEAGRPPTGKDDDSDHSSDENNENQPDGDVECGLAGATAGTQGADVGSLKARGTEVEFRGLQLLDATASLSCSRLAITVQCSRCKNRHDFETQPEKACSSQCTRCGHALVLCYHTSLMHPYSHVCGYLDLEGCQPFELLLARCDFVVSCLECNKNEKLNDLYYGSEKTTWCLHCHAKMRLSLQRVLFKHLQPSGPLQVSNKDTAASAKKPRRPPNDIPVKAGEPLPSNGSCKHYKKSYRWLRFPCCGKCYPCDICHEEGEEHEMKFASRMICGFCAKEQPFANKPCIGCESNVTRSSSSHWEGGKGCRDKIRMSRTDDRKYTNQNKTQSKKAQSMESSKRGGKSTKLRHS